MHLNEYWQKQLAEPANCKSSYTCGHNVNSWLPTAAICIRSTLHVDENLPYFYLTDLSFAILKKL